MVHVARCFLALIVSIWRCVCCQVVVRCSVVGDLLAWRLPVSRGKDPRAGPLLAPWRALGAPPVRLPRTVSTDEGLLGRPAPEKTQIQATCWRSESDAGRDFIWGKMRHFYLQYVLTTVRWWQNTLRISGCARSISLTHREFPNSSPDRLFSNKLICRVFLNKPICEPWRIFRVECVLESVF